MAGSGECGNESSGSIKFGEFLDWLRTDYIQGGSNMNGTDVCKQAALRSSCATLRE